MPVSRSHTTIPMPAWGNPKGWVGRWFGFALCGRALGSAGLFPCFVIIFGVRRLEIYRVIYLLPRWMRVRTKGHYTIAECTSRSAGARRARRRRSPAPDDRLRLRPGRRGLLLVSASGAVTWGVGQSTPYLDGNRIVSASTRKLTKDFSLLLLRAMMRARLAGWQPMGAGLPCHLWIPPYPGFWPFALEDFCMLKRLGLCVFQMCPADLYDIIVVGCLSRRLVDCYGRPFSRSFGK